MLSNPSLYNRSYKISGNELKLFQNLIYYRFENSNLQLKLSYVYLKNKNICCFVNLEQQNHIRKSW
jgi:hypothetical protein